MRSVVSIWDAINDCLRATQRSSIQDLYLGKLYIILSDEVERRLRLAAVVRLGGKKGDLSAAIEAAVIDWLEKKPKDRT
jgi:hypothetical protein